VFLTFELIIETSTLWFGAYSAHSAALHERIMELRGEGLGYRRIAKQLNAEGLKTPRGKVWTSPHVHGLIKKRKLRDQRLHAPPVIRLGRSGLCFMERRRIDKWKG
jgi:hypothetical protein